MNNAKQSIRPKKVISLGFFRTGSQSLKEALTILGYRDVFHSSNIANPDQNGFKMFRALNAACDANIASIPSYTGQVYTREQWDELFAPCEALTDLTPFSEHLINAYPEAKFILVRRDFDSWAKSFLETLARPSYTLAGRLSGGIFERLIGVYISQNVWKMYMGLFGVCSMTKVTDIQILRVGYERHYDMVKRMVPPGQLLELNLRDLNWEPLCKFLGKPVPDQPFPRLNESKVFQDKFLTLHRKSILGGTLKLSVPMVLGACGFWVASWLTRSGFFLPLDVLKSLVGTEENIMRCVLGGVGVLAGSWWASTRGFFA